MTDERKQKLKDAMTEFHQSKYDTHKTLSKERKTVPVKKRPPSQALLRSLKRARKRLDRG